MDKHRRRSVARILKKRRDESYAAAPLRRAAELMMRRMNGSSRPTDRGFDRSAGDWESLGRLVRQRALEAVSVHFLALAWRADQVASDGDPDRPIPGNDK